MGRDLTLSQKDLESEVVKIKEYNKSLDFFSFFFIGLLGIKIFYSISYTHHPHFHELVLVTIIGTIYYLITGIGLKSIIIQQSYDNLIVKAEYINVKLPG